MRIVKKSKKGIELDMLGWILLGVAALVIIIISFIYLRAKGTSAIDFIQNLFRLRK